MVEKVEWPGWEIVGVIGKGAYGAVYEIQRDVFGTTEKAALKVISIPKDESEIEELVAEGYDNNSITMRYQSYLEDIIKEYSIMSKMKGNSNIVDCDDVRYSPKADGYGWNIYIKMELLRPLLKELGTEIPEQDVIALGKDISRALVLCKSQNIIHRDIKPQNIFLSKYGTYKLGDFGVAKISEKTSTGTVIGTFRFMAPEVYRNQPYSFSSDIYSLGMVMYWMLNEKRAPFMPLPPAMPTARDEELARNRRMRGEPLPPPAHGSRELKRIVMKMCAFAPDERYETPEQVLTELGQLSWKPSSSDEADDLYKTVQVDYSRPAAVDDDAETILDSLPRETAREARREERPPAGKKRAKKGIRAAVVSLAAVLLAALGLMLFRGMESRQAAAALPTQREMMNDAAALLRANGVDGAMTSLELQSESQNQNFQTSVNQCEVTVVDQGVEYIHHITLIYEQEADGWMVSNLSRVNH